MRRSLLALALVLGVLPATASAAPFGEVAFRPAGGTATCLRATGLPGEVVRSTSTGAQFLTAGPGGLKPVADVASEGRLEACPQAAAQPNGAGIVAFALQNDPEPETFVRVALREPGGTWGPHADVAVLSDVASAHPLAADVSERGDAVVAMAGSNEAKRFQIVAARRAPGGAFGGAETVFTAPEGASSQARVLAGAAANGDAIVTWSFQAQTDKPRELWAAIAPAGGPFGAPAKVATLRPATSFGFAVNAGGQALLAFASGDDDVMVAERGPGGGFGPPARVGAGDDAVRVTVTPAIRADGGAVVAWSNALGGDVQAALRTGPGAFGAPVAIAPRSGLRFPRSILDLYAELVKTESPGSYTSSAADPDDDGGDARASITPDGRAVVTLAGLAERNGVWWQPPVIATVPLAGGAPSYTVLGAELREAGATTALTTADGTLGIAWADNGERDRDGRLHLALEGVPDGADPAPPRLTVIAPKRRVLAADEPLRFGLRCSAACDVQVQVGSGILAANEDFSLARAGERRISLDSSTKPIASLRGGPVTVRVRYAAPGARRSAGRTVTYRLRRLPDAPVPKLLGVVARRDGDDVVVTWRTDRDTHASAFTVMGNKNRSGDVYNTIGYEEARGGPRRFRARLQNAREVRYVRVYVVAKGARNPGMKLVRVRG